jgi:hypothetical protein
VGNVWDLGGKEVEKGGVGESERCWMIEAWGGRGGGGDTVTGLMLERGGNEEIGRRMETRGMKVMFEGRVGWGGTHDGVIAQQLAELDHVAVSAVETSRVDEAEVGELFAGNDLVGAPLGILRTNLIGVVRRLE